MVHADAQPPEGRVWSQSKGAEMDMSLRCRETDCASGGLFVWSEGEQQFYASKGFTAPTRCANCRAARKGGTVRANSGGLSGSRSGQTSPRPARRPKQTLIDGRGVVHEQQSPMMGGKWVPATGPMGVKKRDTQPFTGAPRIKTQPFLGVRPARTRGLLGTGSPIRSSKGRPLYRRPRGSGL